MVDNESMNLSWEVVMTEGRNCVEEQLRSMLREILSEEDAGVHPWRAQASALLHALDEAAEAKAPEGAEAPGPAGAEPSPEAGAEALLRCPAATVMTANLKARAEDLLNQIQYATEDGRDTSLLEKDLCLIAGGSAEWKERIAVARRRGEKARMERSRLDDILKDGVCSQAMKGYWRELPSRAGWFVRKAARMIVWRFRKELEASFKKSGLQAAEALLLEARRIFGAAVEGVSIPDAWRSSASRQIPDVVRGTEHTLYSRRPVQEWDVYIDETGLSFSESEAGTEGRVVAVCVPQGLRLPDLGSFHSTDAPLPEVLAKFNILLESRCGILGFTRSALGTRAEEGWLQSIRELVKWVWRLIPVQENGHPVGLRFHVEQRSAYSSRL
ncbi:MAG: hypothetical protein K6E40_15355, partial [Desulfovibrio sp.]|nr:hypothetical protein [Desulfovibrio sp.]